MYHLPLRWVISMPSCIAALFDIVPILSLVIPPFDMLPFDVVPVVPGVPVIAPVDGVDDGDIVGDWAKTAVAKTAVAVAKNTVFMTEPFRIGQCATEASST